MTAIETTVVAAATVLLAAVVVATLYLATLIKRLGRETMAPVAAGESAQPRVLLEQAQLQRDSGPFTQKQLDVYARLYARYRRAADSFAPVIGTARDPEFTKFSRDDLLRYLKRRNVRERDAGDAIASLDRGDTFAMGRLMSRLHAKVNYRDANESLTMATRFEAFNELYLSEAVREAAAALREKLTAVLESIGGEPDGRTDRAKQQMLNKEEIDAALATLQGTIRDELRGEQRPGQSLPRPARLTARPEH